MAAKQSIAERAKARQTKRPGACWFTMSVTQYGAELVAEVAEGVTYVRDGKLTARQLADECEASGIKIDTSTIRSHALKGCRVCGAS